MSKNIVICCDGTGNEYGDCLSNVLKLYSVLPKTHPEQTTWYDPGVGTYVLPRPMTAVARGLRRALGLGFGLGITDNIADAYRFLMRSYEPGDKVYLFGFSRGAYTARALAAMLYKVGLLAPRNDNLIPYALKLFRQERRPRIYAGFRRSFSRKCSVHFLGLWDTVKSVGWVYDPLVLQFTMRNRIVKHLRHAVSIDERRCFFRQNLWGEPYPHQDVRQVWFAGVHADVGGGYPEQHSGLSQVALEWMVKEARAQGLIVDPKRYRVVVPEPEAPCVEARPPQEAAAPDHHLAPNPCAPLNRSLRGAWWIPEFIPKLYADPRQGYRKRLMIPAGRRRVIPEGSLLHRSVQQRMEALGERYAPPNLPSGYEFCE